MNCKQESQKSRETGKSAGGSQVVSSTKEAGDARAKLSGYIQIMIGIARATASKIPCAEKYKYSCYEEIVQQHGQFFEPIADADLPANFFTGRPEANFRNAFDMMNKHLIYTEGFAVIKGQEEIINHAWVIDAKTSRVIDPTFRDNVSVYYGIPFKKDFVLRRAAETMRAGIFENDLNAAYPILVHGLPESAFWRGELEDRSDLQKVSVKTL